MVASSRANTRVAFLILTIVYSIPEAAYSPPRPSPGLPGASTPRPCLVAVCKVFEMTSFYIWSIKRRLITK